MKDNNNDKGKIRAHFKKASQVAFVSRQKPADTKRDLAGLQPCTTNKDSERQLPKRRGRKQKPDALTETITVPVTKNDKKRIKAECKRHGMTMGGKARCLLLDIPLPEAFLDKEMMSKTTLEINKVGHILNQISRKSNSNMAVQEDVEIIRSVIVKIGDSLCALIEAHRLPLKPKTSPQHSLNPRIPHAH